MFFLFTKYEKSSVMWADMCTKPFLDKIIIPITKCMTEFIFYINSDTDRTRKCFDLLLYIFR